MFSTSQLYLLSIGLHVLLLFIYLALVGVGQTGAERRIVMATNDGNILTKHLSSIVQTIITLYSAALLYVTQSLSLRRMLIRKESLTASHDISSAWNGLGSGFSSLYDQLSVTAAVWEVSAVAAYLTCLSLLHIATPTLFTLELFNATSPLTITAIQAFPNPNLPEYDIRPSVNASNTFPVPFLAKLQANTPGLLGPIIFDALPVSSGTGNVTVNSTTFDFTCGSVQGYISEETPSDANLGISMNNWIFRSDQTDQPLVGISNILGPNTINTSNSIVPFISGFRGASSNYANQLILTSTYNISDSQGVVESVYTLPFKVEMEEVPSSGGNTSFYNISSIQVIGCTLSLLQQTAIVDVPSGNLLQVNNPVNNLSSAWKPFLLVNSTSGGMEFFWTIFFGLPLIPVSECWSPAGSDPGTDCAQVSLVDATIMELLALPPFAEGPDVPQQITLEMLEEALANVSALMSWVFLRSAGAEIVDVTSKQFNLSNLPSYDLEVNQTILQFRLNLNSIQLWSSTVVVLILLLLAIILTFGVREEEGVIHDAGLLPLIWAAHREKKIRNLMSSIDDPSSTNLRKEGLYLYVQLGVDVQRRRREPELNLEGHYELTMVGPGERTMSEQRAMSDEHTMADEGEASSTSMRARCCFDYNDS